MERLTDPNAIASTAHSTGHGEITFYRDEEGEWVAVVLDWARRPDTDEGIRFNRTRVYHVMDEDELIPVLDGLLAAKAEPMISCSGDWDCTASTHIKGCYSADPRYATYRTALELP